MFFSRPFSCTVPVVVDIFLGTQLLRLRHSWRAWAMVRAALGVVIGAFGIVIGFLALGVGGIPGRPAPLPRLMVVAGVTAYCASLLLLLYSRPTLRRVRLGQLVFAASVLLVVAGGVVTALREI